ncbi:hypothetical protein MKEN_00585700 [Mycena kentingensis (nom. inval.)]|nr:hypothetical protein MKEN_00585700 [Mycena kentingensis (nom. inval.)]
MPTAPNEVYHQLYSHKHGIPQFTPEPNENLPAAYQRVGTSIGDVGVWRNGSFEVLFNACQPANDGINSHFPVPHEFQPFLLNQSAISRRMYHSPGAIIATARTYTVALDVGGSSVVPP